MSPKKDKFARNSNLKKDIEDSQEAIEIDEDTVNLLVTDQEISDLSNGAAQLGIENQTKIANLKRNRDTSEQNSKQFNCLSSNQEGQNDHNGSTRGTD
ncbi:hypothetical protein Bhyg_08736, partial [Pseudolycoriella hygida]